LSSYSGYLLIDGGAGYNGGVTILNYQLLFSPDPNGVSAKLQVDIVGGKITNIDGIIDNGATYSAPPTLNVNALSPTAPATIAFGFQTTYKLYVSNRGINYLSFPVVSVETQTYSSGTQVKGVDPNINDNLNNVLGAANILSNNSTIYGGIIKCNSNGDTLMNATSAFSSAPVFTVAPVVTKKALLSIATGNINADSTLGSISITDAGLGYNPTPPPVVTLTTLAGYGSGAVAKTTVGTAAGALTAIYVTSPGAKYVKNVNDYTNAGVIVSTYDPPSFPNTSFSGIKPGDVTTQDVYYGTGYQILNQGTGKK
jgi:hypothetical protein